MSIDDGFPVEVGAEAEVGVAFPAPESAAPVGAEVTADVGSTDRRTWVGAPAEGVEPGVVPTGVWPCA
ncbi:hypothetical protein AB0C77_23540 [Streptomyces sp. NPDC048629]|uniref:hypothetical protein n=1 Tax=Streptomyces sp. NPDC048629 TaxID=3154824 RepID=UPI00341FFC9B